MSLISFSVRWEYPKGEIESRFAGRKKIAQRFNAR